MQPHSETRALTRAAWCRGLRTPPRRPTWQWAVAERRLGREEGPHPGPFRIDRTPFFREPMERIALSHPAERVTLVGSAQIGKTVIGTSLIGQIIDETPTSVLVVLPSDSEARGYVRQKLQPMIDHTPTVKQRVRDMKSSDDDGSTVLRKTFPGGSVEITGASSAKGLQMRSVRVLICEEVSDYPFDVDGRGDPVRQAEARTTAFEASGQRKIIKIGTPGIEGACRLTADYDAGSKAMFHVPCPDCGAFQDLKFAQLRYDPQQIADVGYACAECRTVWPEAHKAAIVAQGIWVHARPDLAASHATYQINALASPFVSWAGIARAYEDSRIDRTAAKAFSQQVLGEAYREQHDVPSAEMLFERRAMLPPRRIPAGVLFLEGATDVQGDRLEWGVYGFYRDFTSVWVDGGIIAGPIDDRETLAAHDQVMTRRWRDAWGREWAAESWGIDAGYRSQDVYRLVRRHAHRGQPRVMALDGRPGWGLAPIGSPKPVGVDYNGKKMGDVALWPVGTWELKSEITGALQKTIEGPKVGAWPPGAMLFPAELSLDFFHQMTAEACVATTLRAGYARRQWIKVRSRNEQFDLAVYCRALARHDTAGLDEAQWTDLQARRLAPAEQDLITMMTSGIFVDAVSITDLPAPAPEQPRAPAPDAVAEPGWFSHGDGSWFEEARI